MSPITSHKYIKLIVKIQIIDGKVVNYFLKSITECRFLTLFTIYSLHA